jgi:hypothetical protein
MRKTLPATKQRSRAIGKTALHIRPDHGLEFAPPW